MYGYGAGYGDGYMGMAMPMPMPMATRVWWGDERECLFPPGSSLTVSSSMCTIRAKVRVRDWVRVKVRMRVRVRVSHLKDLSLCVHF